MELIRPSEITHLTEESFYSLVGDYFAKKQRIEEINERLEQFGKVKKDLPPLKAFETYAEYLNVQKIHDSSDELTEPVETRLKKEQDEAKTHLKHTLNRLKELLPEGVWFKYGDQGIRIAWYCKVDGEYHATKDYSYYEKRLQTAQWSRVGHIPKTVSRSSPAIKTGPGILKKSYESGILSDNHAPEKAMVSLGLSVIAMTVGVAGGMTSVCILGVLIFLLFPYFVWRDGLFS